MTNSRQKGKRGELEAAAALRDVLGVFARRGQQFCGTPESPDVMTSLNGVHFEVKRCERINVYAAIDQAIADAGDNIPVVLHRRNRREWLVVLRLSDLSRLCSAVIR